MYQFWNRQIWSSLTQIRSTSWNGDRYCIIIIIVIVIFTATILYYNVEIKWSPFGSWNKASFDPFCVFCFFVVVVVVAIRCHGVVGYKNVDTLLDIEFQRPPCCGSQGWLIKGKFNVSRNIEVYFSTNLERTWVLQ